MFARYKSWVEHGMALAVPGCGDSGLYTMLQYHLGWVDQSGNKASSDAFKGKSVRPILCLFACDALSGDLERASPAAAALELIHNFSLIHDDIQDRDQERRHQPTVWCLWGVPKAITAGNALQCVGDLALLDTATVGGGPHGALPEIVLKVSQLLTSSYLEMIQGQCMDLAFEGRSVVTTDEYLDMIAGKTGALIRSGLEIGALLATDDLDAVDGFSRFGNALGRTFQIRDDYLGIWGDQAATGKAAGNDILRRKKSFPIVFALEQAQGRARDDLVRIFRQPEVKDTDLDRVLAVLDEVGAREESQRLADASANEALGALDGVSLPSWAREEAEELVEFVARREH
jgi:geranylgeranyl diphosphate synthase type I